MNSRGKITWSLPVKKCKHNIPQQAIGCRLCCSNQTSMQINLDIHCKAQRLFLGGGGASELRNKFELIFTLPIESLRFWTTADAESGLLLLRFIYFCPLQCTLHEKIRIKNKNNLFYFSLILPSSKMCLCMSVSSVIQDQ